MCARGSTGSCNSACVQFDQRNNIVRVTDKSWEWAGPAANWSEDYNDFSTDGTAPGLEYRGTAYDCSAGEGVAEYRAKSGEVPANKADNTTPIPRLNQNTVERSA